MKSTTHNLFSIGLVLFIVSYFEHPLIAVLVLAAMATVPTNVFIDRVGHASRHGVPMRKWRTHSIITAPFWGAAAWALTLILPAALVGAFPSDLTLLRFVALGVLAGWSHLLLDCLTEGGVFAFDGRRWAVAHFSYDNLLLNLGFSALGLILLLRALLPGALLPL